MDDAPRTSTLRYEREMKTIHHLIPNNDGWLLSLTQTWDPEQLDRERPPVLIVPGYGMNSFIFSFHPNGISLEGFLAKHGFEVWRVDLRASGESIRRGGAREVSFESLALVDLPKAIHGALERTRTTAATVDVIGASLGGTLSTIHACVAPDHRMRSLVLMGSPVRWVEIHPLVRWMFASPFLVGMVKVRGTRKLAELALPLLARHTPWLLGVYMNPEASDVTAAKELVRTVEDPDRRINQQIARWIKDRDLVVRNVNVTVAMGAFRLPLLTIAANGDGIVPLETARFAHDAAASEQKRLVVVGSEEVALAHADLFISRQVHETVYRPIVEWLGSIGRTAAA